MNKTTFFLFLMSCGSTLAQSYAPAAGQTGSTAIHKDSSAIVNWATGIELTRGYKDIALPDSGYVSYGTATDALGQADGTGVVSLGDGGIAVLTFEHPIADLSGPDFAVFENGFADDYLELAHVEVSSDGVNFVRFPSVSETPVVVQSNNFSFTDCRYIYNLASKYRQSYGTPFDLSELAGTPGLDVMHVTHIRLIDVVGSIDSLYGTYDSQGNIINDPYPTFFASGGFDLDAVAVLNEGTASIETQEIQVAVYPNPAVDQLHLSTGVAGSQARLVSVTGQELQQISFDNQITLDVSAYSGQVLILYVTTSAGKSIQKVLVK